MSMEALGNLVAALHIACVGEPQSLGRRSRQAKLWWLRTSSNTVAPRIFASRAQTQRRQHKHSRPRVSSWPDNPGPGDSVRE